MLLNPLHSLGAPRRLEPRQSKVHRPAGPD